jgi:pyruvate formate lyase activating enzyme
MEMKTLLEQRTVAGELYERCDDGRLLCYACGHECRIPQGRPGVCRVRFNHDGVLMVPSGYVGALACDPIEKKPFFHAFPGRDALSFGMLGCDLHCSYCQNWITSQTLRDPAAVAPAQDVSADQLVDLALKANAPVVASTYNEPLITSEWAIDILRRAAAGGLVGAYISNGNATRRVLEYIRPYVQLYKVDLKSFQDREYRRLGGQLPNVLRTIRQLHEMGFWLEVVTLIVPGLNDSDDELRQMAEFLVDISPDIPWHVTAFHSDYRMSDTPSTQVDQLLGACEIGRTAGLRYIYAGNRPGMTGDWESTYCPGCGDRLIERHGFLVRSNRLVDGHCPSCRRAIPGFWSADCVVPQQNMGTPHWLER